MPSKWNFLVAGQAGLYQTSSFGGILTILAMVILCILFRSELNNYLYPPTNSYMKLHKSMELSSVQIKFDIDFFNIPCDLINFSQEVAKASMHSHEPEHLQKEPITMSNRTNKLVPVGCRVFGYAITDKAGGMFRFGKTVPPPPLDKTGKLIESDELSRELSSYKLSHRINHLMFLPHNHAIANEEDIPGKDHMLNGHKVESSDGTAVHQYSLQIVETLLAGSRGSARGAVKANQYSVTQRDMGINLVSQGVTIHSNKIKNFWGIVFLYDFSPISLHIKEEKISFLSFLGSLCGILGGVYTMFSLFERVAYTTSKKVLGKKD